MALLEISDLVVRYGKALALDGVRFSVEAGELVGVLGVEQAQHQVGGVLGGHGEVDAMPVPRGAQGVRDAGPDREVLHEGARSALKDRRMVAKPSGRCRGFDAAYARGCSDPRSNR